VASGDVTDNSAVLWTRAVTLEEVTLAIATDSDFSDTLMTVTRTPDPANDFTIKIDTAGNGSLAPATRYFYRFESGGLLSPVGAFQTAPPADATAPLRFAFSGDSEGATRPHAIFATFPDDGLDFFIYLGDTIYADRPSPVGIAETLGEFRAKYREMRERVSSADPQYLLRALAAVPFWCGGDDHEVVDNFSGGAVRTTDDRFADSPLVDPARPPLINNTRRYSDGMRAFGDYMPLREAVVDAPGEMRSNGAPRRFRSFSWGRVARIIILDERSFRDAALPDGGSPFDRAASVAYVQLAADPARTLLGHTQLAWLKDELLAAQAAGQVWKFIANPEPIQNLSSLRASDRWDGYLAERNDILSFIAAHDIRNVVWLTTDLHLTLVNDLFYVDDLQANPSAVLEGSARHPAAGSFEIITGPLGFDPPAGAFIRPALAALNLAPAFFGASESNIAVALNTLLTQVGLNPLGLPPERVNILQGPADPLRAAVVDQFSYTVIDADEQSATFTVRGIPAYTGAHARLAIRLAALGWPDMLRSLVSSRAVDVYSFRVPADPPAE
jgi:phosphodiesterase/alkaline phosphatase D-like protein